MTGSLHSRIEVAKTRSDLAAIGVDLTLIRAERALRRKYRPDQPREPSGQPGGGRWTSGDPNAAVSLGDGRDPQTTGSIGGDSSSKQEEVFTPDGSRVLSIRVRPNNSVVWDEQHTVTAPDGERTIFEMEGRTQTIRDGATGSIIARSTLTRNGVVPEAFFQSVRGAGPLREVVAKAIRAAGTLFAILSKENDRLGRTIFEAPASEYRPGMRSELPAVWVGRVDNEELNRECPRNRQVQAIADASAKTVRAADNYKNEQEFGTRVHLLIADVINSLDTDTLVAEKYFDESG